MRKIIFRGKRSANGEWVEGDLLNHDNRVGIHNQFGDGTMNVIDVDPETVGQYTGLNDKNGKRIFEGDILSLKNETHKDIAVVCYKGPEFYLEGSMGGIFFREALHFFSCVIIGNIHDNPELLEVQG